MGTAATLPARWIVSAPYDLAWFFGGAALSLAFLLLYFGGVPVLVLWWGWILLLDGPHIAAAFTRTYLDREEWSRRRSLLLTSLLTFAVGPVFLLANVITGSADPFLLFLALSAFYAYYHVVRQHYGFLALYDAKTRDARRVAFRIDTWVLYVGCWTPYLYFLLTHPRARAILRLPESPSRGGIEQVLTLVLLAVWCLSLAILLVRAAAKGRGLLGDPKTAYLLVTFVVYSSIYFLVAPMEPVYGASNGPDQDFLLISALVTVFHNVQYLGLVWFHNRNRYTSGRDFGPAQRLSRTPALYLAGCVLFSVVVYGSFACTTGAFPGCAILLDTRVGPFTANQIGLCLWWGLAINHYYLDQKIWRVRGDPELRRNLGLA
jgi:hypothetical protein